jgi:hypothetical protein
MTTDQLIKFTDSSADLQAMIARVKAHAVKQQREIVMHDYRIIMYEAISRYKIENPGRTADLEKQEQRRYLQHYTDNQ